MTAEVHVAQRGTPGGEGARELVASILRVLVPILLALIVGGIILLILGKDPLAYYGYVVRRGLLTWGGLQETLTRTLPVEDRLPRLFDTTIHSGVLIALAVVVLVHLMMTRTSFGLKLQVVGANPAAAVHAGLNVAWLTIATFAISAGLIRL